MSSSLTNNNTNSGVSNLKKRSVVLGSSRSLAVPSPVKLVEKVKSTSYLRTPHNARTTTSSTTITSQAIQQRPVTRNPQVTGAGGIASNMTTVSGQFKARPMPNFKALHATKPAVLPRTVHTPTAVPQPVTTTSSTNVNVRTIVTSRSSSHIMPRTHNKQVRTTTSGDANKENAKKDSTNVYPTRPITIRKGI